MTEDTNNAGRSQAKRQRLELALLNGIAQLHVDARRPGVDVPPQFAEEQHLVLNFSHRFDPADLAISAWGVRQTLSFGGSRDEVAIPWDAIYGVASLASREFWMFPDDMPQSLTSSSAEATASTQEKSKPTGGRRGHLRLVK